jgi:hypothetical protein
MWINHGATVTMVNCNFTSNNVTSSDTGNAVLSINASNEGEKQQDTIVRLQQCIFKDNYADYDVATNDYEFSAFVYGNNATLKVHHNSTNGATQGMIRPLAEAPTEREGINGSSPWIQMVKKVCSFGASLLQAHLPMTATSVKNFSRQLHCSALCTCLWR